MPLYERGRMNRTTPFFVPQNGRARDPKTMPECAAEPGPGTTRVGSPPPPPGMTPKSTISFDFNTFAPFRAVVCPAAAAADNHTMCAKYQL